MGQLQSRIEAAVNKTGTYNEALQNLADAFGAPASETGSRLIPVVKVFDPTIDNATAAQNYLLYNSTVVAGGIPAMALNFTSSESLDSRITFSRASNATVVNSDGLIAYAPHNLLTNSESFEEAAWQKLASTVSSNVTAAPDGTTTADKLVEDTSASAHRISSAGFTASTIPYGFSFYAKSAGRQYAYIRGNNAGGDFIAGNVDLSTASVTESLFGTISATSIGNGWVRIVGIGTPATAGSATVEVRTSNSATYANYTGDGTSGIFIWGAQLNQGPLQPYYFTTPKNLLGYTQEFDNATWSKSAGATIGSNAVVAPDGNTTADNVTLAASGDYVYQAITATYSAGAAYTFSMYVKSANRAITWGGATPAGTDVYASTDVGNGWYRQSLTRTFTSAGTSVTIQTMLLGSQPAGLGPYAVWGAQLSNSASLDPYVYNPGAAPTSTAYYGPRFDYDPVTLAPKGLLIEEQRTNLLTYSEDFSNAAWVKAVGAVSQNQTTAPNGTDTADKLTDATAINIYQQVTTTASQNYVYSVFLKASGSVTNCDLYIYQVGVAFVSQARFNLSTGVIVSQPFGAGATITAVGDGWYKCTVTGSHAGTTTSAGVYNSTEVFAWGAQLEAGSFATSYIPTVASQVTRSADNASMTGANFSNWYNASEGTLYAEADGLSTAGTRILGIGPGPSNLMYLTLTLNSVVANGISQASFVFTPAANTYYKTAMAYKQDDFAGSYNGSITTDASGSVPIGMTTATIGWIDSASAFVGSGHIRRIMYYNTRLTNAQLQALTS